MGRLFYFGDAWTRNEERSQRLAEQEGHYDGHDSAPEKEIEGGGRKMRVKQDAALGLDGQDFHMGGERVTKMKEERLPGGDIAVYWQSEHGGTFRQVWAKVGDGRHQSTGRPRRVHTS